ncbi:MAG TPA: hypothetical protein DCY00_03815 [Actinobacteria bacterium]|nr:hypothetical protein [Actinomycetota bacterium]
MIEQIIKMRIGIGICTYKRPEMLKKCLESINEMLRPEDAEIIIIIADNDINKSSQVVVNNFKAISNIQVYEKVEENRGIPYARNNILKRGKALKITELAFIDDDEYVDKNWLINLWEYYKKTKADVVRGFVKTVYPADTPQWIIKGKYYQRKAFKEGEIQNSASTNNVLFDFKKICIEKKMVFDESFGMKGGSDTDFFRKVYKLGLKILATNDAIVYEELEKERYQLSYLLKRKFRTRNNKLDKNSSFIKKIRVFMVSFFNIFRGIITLPINIIIGKHKAIGSLVHIVSGLAKLLGLFNIHLNWEEYNK